MPMNPEIKARWTAALRSGEYLQGKNFLRTTDGFCCLGVLCELAVTDGVIASVEPGAFGDYWEYGDQADESKLPWKVAEWAGLHQNNPRVDLDALPDGVDWDSTPDDGGNTLANMNDGGTTFAVIADIIDAQL